MRAVGGEDGSAYVSADLRSAEQWCLARACLPLQRESCAVPPRMPPLYRAPSSLDCVASGECCEAASGVVCSVLEEDVMLSFGAEVRHYVLESEQSRQRASGTPSRWAARKTNTGMGNARTSKREELQSNQVHEERCNKYSLLLCYRRSAIEVGCRARVRRNDMTISSASTVVWAWESAWVRSQPMQLAGC